MTIPITWHQGPKLWQCHTQVIYGSLHVLSITEFVQEDQMNNKSALVREMTWHRSSSKSSPVSISDQSNRPLCEPWQWRKGKWYSRPFNTLMPRQYSRHFAIDTFKRIFLNKNATSWIKISLKFVPKGPINNIPALVQLMTWRHPGDAPLCEPMTVRLPTNIGVTRPQ